MGASLFDDIERFDDAGKPHGEPKFDYLNRSARPEAERVREFMEHCFGHYPADSRADVRGRCR
jgi:hypothetical protein